MREFMPLIPLSIICCELDSPLLWIAFRWIRQAFRLARDKWDRQRIFVINSPHNRSAFSRAILLAREGLPCFSKS